MTIKRYVKTRVKNIKEPEVFNIGNNHIVVKKIKKRGYKYLVSVIDDLLFFNYYESVVMTKSSLIKMLINEYEK